MYLFLNLHYKNFNATVVLYIISFSWCKHFLFSLTFYYYYCVVTESKPRALNILNMNFITEVKHTHAHTHKHTSHVSCLMPEVVFPCCDLDFQHKSFPAVGIFFFALESFSV